MRPELRGSPVLSCMIDEATGRITLEWPDRKKMVLGGRLGALTSAREELDEMLMDFRKAVAVPAPGAAQVVKALRVLVGRAETLVRLLLGDSVSLRLEIEERLWQTRSPLDALGDDVGFVEVHGHLEFFPFELLPLHPAVGDQEFRNLADAERLLERFLGYRLAIRRLPLAEIVSAPLERDNDGAVPVQFLRYEMAGAVREARYLGKRVGDVRLDGPWPPPHLEADAVEHTLLNVLHDPRRCLDGGHSSMAAQIQHFACHCDTGWDDPKRYALVLGRGAGHKTTLGRMYDGLLERGRIEQWNGPRPLVLLNACGGARIPAAKFSSFPLWFLENGYRGFVGAEVDIPDVLAAEYAKRFYDELLSGQTLGAAVVRARVQMFRDLGNPLGLLYVMYGDPFLRIRHKESL
jgi:CHAT domain